MNPHSTEMMLKKLADQQMSQSLQGFTVPKPSKCKDYGTEYEQGVENLNLLPKILLAAGVIFMLILLVKLYPY